MTFNLNKGMVRIKECLHYAFHRKCAVVKL